MTIRLKNGTVIFLNRKKKTGMIKGTRDDLFFIDLTKEDVKNLEEGDDVIFETKGSKLDGLLDIKQKAINIKKNGENNV